METEIAAESSKDAALRLVNAELKRQCTEAQAIQKSGSGVPAPVYPVVQIPERLILPDHFMSDNTGKLWFRLMPQHVRFNNIISDPVSFRTRYPVVALENLPTAFQW